MAQPDRPHLFLLPFLAATGHQWAGVVSRLNDHVRCVTIDLPGFGDAADRHGYTVADMADAVAGTIRAHAPARWFIAGHSMGAKVATVVARRAEDGGDGLAGLEGIVLVAGSPPCPEPMDDGTRADMMTWFRGDAASRLRQARDYVAGNAAGSLDPAVLDRAAADVSRMDRGAWVAWLDQGSREDWADRVGVLKIPALILAGERDAALGPAAQRRHMAPHVAHHRLEVLEGASHLLPLERPEAVAHLIAGFTGV